MKKLNRKGFTLIELLAIIVILAIIMVVTIPTVLGSMGEAKQKTFQANANTIADWFEKQYSLSVADNDLVGPVDTNYTGVCGSDGSGCSTTQPIDDPNVLRAAGGSPENYTATVSITSGRACVTLEATGTGEFKGLSNKTVTSSGCMSEEEE